MQKLKVGDEVIVLAGKDKGRTGEVLSLRQGKVHVKGVNMAVKAIKQSEKNPNASFTRIEVPLHVSNVALVDPKTRNPTRVRIEKREGKTVRVAVASGGVLPWKKKGKGK